MWKKDETSDVKAPPPRSEATPPRNDLPRARSATGDTATIGRSITIKGEVTGDEDLLIQGQIDGSVDLEQHAVTVGPEGKVKAGIAGRIVTVEGTVEGDLKAQEQVILRSTAHVEGDITAPRVVLEDGATFRGGVDMGARSEESRHSGSSQSARRDARTDVTKGNSGSSTSASSAAADENRSSSRESTKERTEKATGATT